MNWDVMGGVARRNWARNENAMAVAVEYNRLNESRDQITIPYLVENGLVEKSVAELFSSKE